MTCRAKNLNSYPKHTNSNAVVVMVVDELLNPTTANGIVSLLLLESWLPCYFRLAARLLLA